MQKAWSYCMIHKLCFQKRIYNTSKERMIRQTLMYYINIYSFYENLEKARLVLLKKEENLSICLLFLTRGAYFIFFYDFKLETIMFTSRVLANSLLPDNNNFAPKKLNIFFIRNFDSFHFIVIFATLTIYSNI